MFKNEDIESFLCYIPKKNDDNAKKIIDNFVKSILSRIKQRYGLFPMFKNQNFLKSGLLNLGNS